MNLRNDSNGKKLLDFNYIHNYMEECETYNTNLPGQGNENCVFRELGLNENDINHHSLYSEFH